MRGVLGQVRDQPGALPVPLVQESVDRDRALRPDGGDAQPLTVGRTPGRAHHRQAQQHDGRHDA